MSNIEKFEKAIGDIKLLNSQFAAYSRTKKFEKSMQRKAITEAGDNSQYFYNEGRAVYDSFLRAEGRLVSGSAKIDGIDKTVLMNDVLSIMPELASIQEFRVINHEKRIGAMRTEEADFEITSTAHREKVIVNDGKGAKIVGTLKSQVEELADRLIAADYNIVQIKNNMITVESDDGDQYSVKITRKKNRIF